MARGVSNVRWEREAWFEVLAVRVHLGERVLRRGHLVRGAEVGRDLELLLAAGCLAPARPTEASALPR